MKPSAANRPPPRARKGKQEEEKAVEEEESTAAAAAAAKTITAANNSIVTLPLPFPAHLPRPATAGEFLRNVPPYRESFAAALRYPYQGFVVDQNVMAVPEADLQRHLSIEKECWFRPDVTQPFGLGTKCAKTYVTRCLMGDAGTTYKYLGLRMFAHPWTGIVNQLKTHLVDRTEHHLQQLATTRGTTIQGRAAFDVCLINRMEASDQLKLVEQNRTAVSWHADSSLEHYSTIAVYQTLLPKVMMPQQLQQHQNAEEDQTTTKKQTKKKKKQKLAKQ
jgi:FTO catalytic domain